MSARAASSRRWARLFLLGVAALMPGPVKRGLLRSCFGFRIGRRVRIGVALFDCSELTIEDDVRIAHGVAFVRAGRVAVVALTTVIVSIVDAAMFAGAARWALGAVWPVRASR